MRRLRRRSQPRSSSATTGADDLAALEFDQLVGQVEVTVVMGDDQQCLALGAQFRQQFAIEHFAERRVLVSSPFVEDDHRPSFKTGNDQRQALALALGQFTG